MWVIFIAWGRKGEVVVLEIRKINTITKCHVKSRHQII